MPCLVAVLVVLLLAAVVVVLVVARLAGPGVWNHVLTRRPRKIECGAICRGGLVFKAHRLLNHSSLGLRVIKKKKSRGGQGLLLYMMWYMVQEYLAHKKPPPPRTLQ